MVCKSLLIPWVPEGCFDKNTLAPFLMYVFAGTTVWFEWKYPAPFWDVYFRGYHSAIWAEIPCAFLRCLFSRVSQFDLGRNTLRHFEMQWLLGYFGSNRTVVPRKLLRSFISVNFSSIILPLNMKKELF